jgi:hypothetical protein
MGGIFMLVIPAALQVQYDLPLLVFRLILFLLFMDKPRQTLLLGRRKMILYEKVQVIAQPLFIFPMQSIRNGLVTQSFFKLAITLCYQVISGTIFSKETPLSSPVTPAKPLLFRGEKPLSVRERTTSLTWIPMLGN